MPAYAYRCRTCDDGFEVRRPMTATVDGPVACPEGHDETTRVFSAVAVGGRAGSDGASQPAPAAPGGGGCCGGGCCG